MQKRRIIVLSAIVIALMLVSSGWIIYRKMTVDRHVKYAEIYQDNQLIRTVDLNDVDESYRLRIDYKENQYNVIEIQKGRIGIVESSCPDHLCENMGFIDTSLVPITCLPNHLVIRIVEEGENDTAGYDAISF